MTQNQNKSLNVLHLSDTTLSGSPVRISKLLNKYSTTCRSRHLVWQPIIGTRVFETDLVSSRMTREELLDKIEWADIIHYHNRYARQEIFKFLEIAPPNKPSVIQIHSPRQSENFSDEVNSGIPLAVVAQYHPRQWPEASFIVPNVVDILDPAYMPIEKPQVERLPIVSYAPSNTNQRGWDDKGYSLVAPTLKRLKISGRIYYQLIVDTPHEMTLKLKQSADIGIDEIATGSYHLSSLEYMSMGVPCFANLDGYTKQVVRDLTGCDELPWVAASKDNFLPNLHFLLENKSWQEYGAKARQWMETYWNPSILVGNYEEMYRELLK